MEQKARKIQPLDWVLAAFTLVIGLLIVVSGVFPNLALLHASIQGQNPLVLILSLWAWLFLIWIILQVKRMIGIQFSRYNRIVLISALVVLMLYYAYSLLTRQFIYYWDYVHYYRMQIGFTEMFQTASFFSGIVSIVKSVWYNAYSMFNNVFLAAPFYFVPKTPNFFVAISAATILPLLYWLIAMFVKMMERLLRPKHSDLFFTGSMVLAVCFPLIHRSLLYGQPDLIGLIFVFLIILLTISYDFSQTDYLRYFLIIALVIMVSASRRWYMFWLVAYFACYGLAIIVHALKNKLWGHLKRIGLFVLATGFILATVFLPKIVVLLRSNFSQSYSAYNFGGFWGELANQARFLGIGLLVLIAGGLIYGVVNRRTRVLTILAVVEIFLTIFIFTRIQNMGYHHTLILVPAYFMLMLILFAGICRLEKIWMLSLSSSVVLLFGVVNASVCAASSADYLPVAFSNSALVPPQRTDIEEIRTLNRWIVEHCTKPDSAYMIPHGYPYNPDVFRACDYPDMTVSKYLPYGSAVLGTHYFPEELLLADYVLTCEPFCDHVIAGRYNEAFLSEIPQKHFALIKEFDMGNGYTFYVYQRETPMDREEIQFYKDWFSEEDKLFPDMFSGVLDSLLERVD